MSGGRCAARVGKHATATDRPPAPAQTHKALCRTAASHTRTHPGHRLEQRARHLGARAACQLLRRKLQPALQAGDVQLRRRGRVLGRARARLRLRQRVRLLVQLR